MKKNRTPFYELSGAPEGQDLGKSLTHALKSAPHPLRLDDILRQTGISRRLKKDVLAELHAQADAGTLVRLQGGAWVSAASLKTFTGILSIQRSGAAFVTPAGSTGGQKSGQDIYIAAKAVGDAWNGDEVEVTLLPGRRGPTQEGRVTRVVRRGQQELTVRVVRPPRKKRLPQAGEEGNPEEMPSFYERALCRPADPRLDFDMLTDVSALPEAPQKDELLRVTVGERLPSPPDNQLWSGTALVSLGKEDDVAVQEQLTKLNHLIPTSFPDDVLAEAEAVARGTSDEAGNATDLRSLPLVTIDGEDARDFDDAVLVMEKGSGWRLVVAIADVSHYVLPHSKLDREAHERGNSYYFPTSVEPMLPEALSNGVCSLRPGEDRRVMVADMDIDAQGNPQGAKFYAGIMRSVARLTYHQAQTMLDDGVVDGFSPVVPPMLKSAGKLATILIERRRKHGGLDFDLPEAEFITENGRVTAVRNRERLFSHRLIEAFMVAANEAVATWLTKKKAPLLYRTHPEPSPEKLESLIRALQATELPLPLPHKAQDKKVSANASGHASDKASGNASWLPALLAAAAQTEQSYLVGRLTLRSMMQARYSPELEGHFGLGSACYCHFTSPIRRYADLVTHRALKEALGLDPGGAIPTGHKLLAVAEVCNGREQAAQDAEREITRRLGCLLLQKRVGEEFHGVISGVTNFGLFVELENMPLEGMIRVETLGQDYFEFDADRQELRGNDTGVAFRLGEAVDVRLVEVNIGRLEVTLLLTGVPDSALDGRRRPPRGREKHGGEQRRNGSFGHTGGRDPKKGAKGGPAMDSRARQGKSADARKTSRKQGQSGGRRGQSGG